MKEQKLNKSFWRFLIFSQLFLALMFFQEASAGGILDNVNNAMAATTSTWMGRSLELAKSLFFGLAVLEFVWSAYQVALKKGELNDVVVSTFFKVMSLSFFYMLLIKAPDWIPTITDSFKQAGAQVSGTTLLTPSGIFGRGLTMAGSLIEKGNAINSDVNGIFALGDHFLAALVIGISAVFVVMAFAIVALQLFVALVESYLIVGGGAIMLGFLGSRWTSSFGEKYFSYALSNGIKLFTLYLLVGMGDTFFDQLYAELNRIAATTGQLSFGDWLGLAGSSAVFGGLSYMLPGLTSSMLNGSTNMGMANIGSAMNTVSNVPIAGALKGSSATMKAGALGAQGLETLKAKASANVGGNTAGAGGSTSSTGGDNGFSGKKSESKIATKLSERASSLKEAAENYKPRMVDDGSSGSSANIKLGHTD